MSITISYSNKSTDNLSSNLVLFSDHKFDTRNFRKYLSNSELIYISDLLKNIDLKKKILVFEVNSKKKIILISIKKDLKTSDIESLGAEFYGRINSGKNAKYFLNSDSIDSKHKNFVGHFLHGLKLKSYEFKNTKQKKKQELFQ